MLHSVALQGENSSCHATQGGAVRLSPLRSALGWYVEPLRGDVGGPPKTMTVKLITTQYPTKVVLSS
jgi:hypothetical protein